MAEINKDPAPQEMIRLIAREADDFIREYGGDLSDRQLHDDAIRLIAQAWSLPPTGLAACLTALREERERTPEAAGEGAWQEVGETEGGEGGSASEFHLPAPHQLISLLWGFFGTAVLLNDRADRDKILEIAVYLMDCLGLDDAIPETCHACAAD